MQTLSIPVIGNGDIACLESLQKMLATGCAGAMIGRAGVGQPWLIQKLLAELNHTPFMMPSQQTIGQLLLQHMQGLCELLNSEKFAIIQSRTFAKYYARALANRREFCDAFNRCESLAGAEQIVTQYFGAPSNLA